MFKINGRYRNGTLWRRKTCQKVANTPTYILFSFNLTAPRFWKRIRSDFPLMMLNANQPLRHIQRMASILSTSCLGDSFGPLSSNESDQRINEGHLLEASTRLLADSPKPVPGGLRYTRVQIVELRQEVLQFLGGVAGMELGVLTLARHLNVLPRLVKRIAEELEEAYEFKFGRDQRYVAIYLLFSSVFPFAGTLPPLCGREFAG